MSVSTRLKGRAAISRIASAALATAKQVYSLDRYAASQSRVSSWSSTIKMEMCLLSIITSSAQSLLVGQLVQSSSHKHGVTRSENANAGSEKTWRREAKA